MMTTNEQRTIWKNNRLKFRDSFGDVYVLNISYLTWDLKCLKKKKKNTLARKIVGEVK